MKKNRPLVSVIMSEYNTDINLLRESITSILNQTYENFELILIDDCGKNDVKNIISKFNDDRIKLYRNKENSGLVYSLNRAISLSNGKYIARMDTDDYSYKDRLKIQIEFLEKNPDIDLIGGNCNYYDGKNIWGKSNSFGEITREKLLNGSTLTHPTVMFKKEIMDKIGGYLNYNRCEDYATWIELFTNGYKLYVIEDNILRYHLSLDDYKKRTLKTRKGFFKMLNEQYKKLSPGKMQIFKMHIKTFLAGIIPGSIMFKYHKNKNKGEKNDT